MACTAAALVHGIPGRTRLKVAERVGDRSYFESVERQLSACPTVLRVSASTLTGSLLILHEGPFARVADFAQQHSLFELVAGPPPHPFANIQHEVKRIDTSLRTLTRERWGVPGVVFYGLVGASLWQLVQGRVLPPSLTLAFQALTMFKQAVDAERTRARQDER